MILLIPLGHETRLVKIPYVTAGLILLTTIVHFLVWPDQKQFMISRFPGAPLNVAAHELAEISLTPKLNISADLRAQIEKEKKENNELLFPTATIERLLRRADVEISDKSWEILERKDQWKASYERYTQLKQSLTREGVPEEGPFDHYAHDPSRGYFPGIFTHMFLHAGILHLVFNMLFLWIVGASIEERWGPPIFLSLYISGGLVSAFAQELSHSVAGIGLVGASGAVAAIMGAFLIRHFKAPICMFYLVFYFTVRTGTFTAPAWTMLLLWLAEQLFSAIFFSSQSGVAYGAHIGGFAYGSLIGWFILKKDVAVVWEKAAEKSEGGMELRAQEAESLFQARDYEKALALFEGQLADNPNFLPAILGSLRTHTALGNKPRLAAFAIRAVNIMLDGGQTQDATFLFDETLLRIADIPLADKDAFGLAQTLMRLNRPIKAIRWYSYILDNYPASPFRGKAMFSMGKIYKGSNKLEEAKKYFQALLEKPYDIEWEVAAQSELKNLSRL